VDANKAGGMLSARVKGVMDSVVGRVEGGVLARVKGPKTRPTGGEEMVRLMHCKTQVEECMCGRREVKIVLLTAKLDIVEKLVIVNQVK